jgi:hypothetical protein
MTAIAMTVVMIRNQDRGCGGYQSPQISAHCLCETFAQQERSHDEVQVYFRIAANRMNLMRSILQDHDQQIQRLEQLQHLHSTWSKADLIADGTRG